MVKVAVASFPIIECALYRECALRQIRVQGGKGANTSDAGVFWVRFVFDICSKCPTNYVEIDIG